MEDKYPQIVEALKQKACTKQKIYRNTLKVFETLKKVAANQVEMKNLLEEISARLSDAIVVQYQDAATGAKRGDDG